MTEQKTSIVVESADPPTGPLERDEPFLLIQTDVSGTRDEDAPIDWSAVEVRPTTYEEMLRTRFKPRFREAVKDYLSGKPDSMLSVDCTFTTTTQHWPRQLLENVPEIAAVMDQIQQLEQLKRYLAQQIPVRNRLEGLLAAAVAPAALANGKAK